MSMLIAVLRPVPISLYASVVVLGVVAMAACLGPAVRATRVAPMTALRDE